MAQRKSRIDSAAGTVEVMVAAVREILPPEHAPLDDDATPFWGDIIA